jgi:hypothetical protein
MNDHLAHTRPFFAKERVIAGPTQFYAVSRFNLAMGPIRDSIEEAEADADRLFAQADRVPCHMVGWGAVG